MARQRAKTTPDSDGGRARSLAPEIEPRQDKKERLTLSHENGNGAATADTQTRIEKLAYELYLQRGRGDGYDKQDWLEAERMTLTPAESGRQERL